MPIFSYFNRQYFDLLFAMTEKEIKARYKKAVFGFLWMILNPILQMLVIGFVFRFVTKIPIDNYFVFLFAGLLPWNFFSLSIIKNTPMFINERSLIQKAKFPREIIILSLVLANAFHSVVSLLILLPVVFYLGVLNIYILWLMVPCLVWVIVLTSGLSLFLSAWNVKFRDVNFIVQALIPLWFYATPIMYTLSFVPDYLRLWFYLNPMTGIIEVLRWVLISEPITWRYGILYSLLVSVVIVVVGIVTFKKDSKYFVDWV